MTRVRVRGAMQLYRFAWLLWIVGTVLILLSWTSAVSPTVGWAGFAVALVGVALSWVSNRAFYPLPPEQKPVSPSGVAVGPDTPLEQGSRVLAYSQGYWWRARVVAIEDGEMVRVDFPGWDPSWQVRVPRSQLQVDLTHSSPGKASVSEGEQRP